MAISPPEFIMYFCYSKIIMDNINISICLHQQPFKVHWIVLVTHNYMYQVTCLFIYKYILINVLDM